MIVFRLYIINKFVYFIYQVGVMKCRFVFVSEIEFFGEDVIDFYKVLCYLQIKIYYIIII